MGTVRSGLTASQATDRTTGVTLHGLSGQITTHDASLAAEAAADCVVTNNQVEAYDVVVASIASRANGGGTSVEVVGVTDGSFTLRSGLL